MKKSVIVVVVILIMSIFSGIEYSNWKKDFNNQTDEVSNEETKESEEEVAEPTNVEKEQVDNIKYVNKESSEVYIPILMYHSISDEDPNNTLLVPPSEFEAEMAYFKEEGFTPMLLGEVIEALETGKVPEKPVAITFDDGYLDNYTDAFKIMKKYDMKGTFFMITKNLDTREDYMSSSMLKEMKEYGMAIESHTHNHVEMNSISVEEQKNEIRESRKILKEKVGVESNFLCYPVGRYNDDTLDVCKEEGLKAAVTTEPGFSNIGNGKYSLKRVRIAPMDIETFKTIFQE